MLPSIYKKALKLKSLRFELKTTEKFVKMFGDNADIKTRLEELR